MKGLDGGKRRARKSVAMTITIRIHDVRVVAKGEDRGPHLQAIGYMPSGQELIRGVILAGHSPSVRADAVADVVDWLLKHRPGWAVDLSEVRP